ncbi:MAG TPA: hypothetical protein VJ032_00240 [Thermoanaerobaculia bacterium]|nr:hypothetical protein [Thermoanaerobaculia bacterium]
MNVFRLLPRRWRYPVAMRIALLLAPLVRRTTLYRRRPSHLDGYREESLRLAIRFLARARVPYDPDLDVRGLEHFPDGAALIVSGHFLLNGLMTRCIFDAHRTLTIILGSERREPTFYAGTLQPIETLIVNPSILVQVRRRLADGGTVLIDIDSKTAREDSMRVETAVDTRWISPSVLQLAEKIGVPVIFTAARVERRRATVTFVKPSSQKADVMLREFCDFYREHIAAIER